MFARKAKDEAFDFDFVRLWGGRVAEMGARMRDPQHCLRGYGRVTVGSFRFDAHWLGNTRRTNRDAADDFGL